MPLITGVILALILANFDQENYSYYFGSAHGAGHEGANAFDNEIPTNSSCSTTNGVSDLAALVEPIQRSLLDTATGVISNATNATHAHHGRGVYALSPCR